MKKAAAWYVPKATKAQWGCYSAYIDEINSGIGTGTANTAVITAGCSETGIAPLICDELVLNGYNDRFLPSKDKLNLNYEN